MSAVRVRYSPFVIRKWRILIISQSMKIIRDCLTELVFTECKRELKDKLHGEEWSSSQLNWTDDVRTHIGSCLASTLTDSLKDMVLRDISEHLPECQRYRCRFYVWQPLSGIPPHTDQNHKFGATIYLNEKWDLRDGGYFMWKEGDGDIWNAIHPQRNMMMVNTTQEWHQVTPVLQNPANLRYTIQIWGD